MPKINNDELTEVEIEKLKPNKSKILNGANDKLAFATLGITWIGYLFLVVLKPLDPEVLANYDLAETSSRILSLVIAPFSLLLWGLMLYAGRSVAHYAKSIKSEVDEPGFRKIAIGLLLIVTALIVSSFAGAVRDYFVQSSTEYKTITIANNTITTAINALAYIFILLGSGHLLRSIDQLKAARKKLWLPIMAIVLIGIGFSYFVFSNPYRTASADPTIPSTYFLSDVYIALSIVIPTLIGWFTASTALIYLDVFQAKVRGVIYKQFVRKFIIGMSLVLSSGIILQFLGQSADYFASIGLASLLGIITLILGVYTVAFYMVASGAYKLKKIEEV